MRQPLRGLVISLVGVAVGAIIGTIGTFSVTVYQDHQEAISAAPDLALSCDDTLSAWQRSSLNTLVAVHLNPADYMPGRYNAASSVFRFPGPHYPSNLPEYLKLCTVRNDGNEVARRVTLSLYAMIDVVHDRRITSVAELPITVSFSAIPEHSESSFLIANMNPGSGVLGHAMSVTYQAKSERTATKHEITVVALPEYLHPMGAPCRPSVPGARWPAIECLNP